MSSSEQLRKEYISRINRVIDYIDKHLDEELTLRKLASVANFSEFHFHRVFASIVKEPLNQFIRRIRLERSADILINHPNKSILEVAFDTGFGGASQFSREFRKYFNTSPSDWRNSYCCNNDITDDKISKISQFKSKNSKINAFETDYFCNVINDDFSKNIWSITMSVENGLKAKVEVKELPEMTVAYIRHIGPYAGNGELFGRLFGKLMNWAGPRGLIRFPETKMMSVYHDNPDITDEEKLRLSVCLTVPPDTMVDGEIGKMLIEKGKYAVAYFEITADQYGAAWDAVFAGWLPQSGYQCSEGVCFENYLNDPQSHPEKKHFVEICVPVKPL
jgi:AraC family transcriptional regulator